MPVSYISLLFKEYILHVLLVCFKQFSAFIQKEVNFEDFKRKGSQFSERNIIFGWKMFFWYEKVIISIQHVAKRGILHLRALFEKKTSWSCCTRFDQNVCFAFNFQWNSLFFHRKYGSKKWTVELDWHPYHVPTLFLVIVWLRVCVCWASVNTVIDIYFAQYLWALLVLSRRDEIKCKLAISHRFF